MKNILFISIALIISSSLRAQPVPNVDENIPYLMTFGKNAETSWGDDDFSQVFFFLVPEDHKEEFYIRVFDPDVGGKIDEIAGVFDSRAVYEVYGGKGNWSDPDARETDPVGNYKSGSLLASRAFAVNPRVDNAWFTFGPFNPAQGEYSEGFKGYIFKVICEGQSGDDGNMYRYFLSTSPDENKEIEGANAFAYEYSFRMHNSVDEISHIYPYVEKGTVKVKISNFDWDNDGHIMVISVMRMGEDMEISGEDHWSHDALEEIMNEEINTSLDFRFIKNPRLVRNNNVVVNVRNQFDEAMPFYTIPIGGVPVYRGEAKADKKKPEPPETPWDNP